MALNPESFFDIVLLVDLPEFCDDSCYITFEIYSSMVLRARREGSGWLTQQPGTTNEELSMLMTGMSDCSSNHEVKNACAELRSTGTSLTSQSNVLLSIRHSLSAV